tara:strand:+ start:131 stop:304 length:174 start_codon:yes stop_codon:yes gene_type:complete
LPGIAAAWKIFRLDDLVILSAIGFAEISRAQCTAVQVKHLYSWWIGLLKGLDREQFS